MDIIHNGECTGQTEAAPELHPAFVPDGTRPDAFVTDASVVLPR